MIPKVVIVGRPNVGKSSLLNLLAGRRVSIVDPTAGVTRDRVSALVELPADPSRPHVHHIELIDTGGWGVDDAQNLTAEIQQQIARGMAQADVLVFVIDAQAGVTPLDHAVARMIRTALKPGIPVVVVANKVDDTRHENDALEATELGFGEPIMVSAATGRQKFEMREAVLAAIDLERLGASSDDAGEPGVLMAIVGKRNAGKSTLVNALAGDDRVIVSEVEGTTRDSVDVRFEMDGRRFTAIDTAGVRRTKSLDGDIEYYSHHRAMRSVRRADVVLLIIDAAVPISQVDRQLVNEIVKHHRPTVIVVNKWDLAERDYTQEQYLKYLDDALKGLSFAPIVFVSATQHEGMSDLLAIAENLYEQAGHRMSTGELNRLIESILAERVPSSKVGKRPKIYYVTQLSVHPPTLGLFVNDPELFDPGYQRFLINRLRDEAPFSEVPIKLVIRPRKRAPRDGEEAPGKSRSGRR